MRSAIQAALDEGARAVALIGSDCPELTADAIARALDATASHDVVLIPAADGGYVLIATSAAHPELFANITWGSPAVLSESVTAARAAGLSVCCLDPLKDVDTEDDLSVWESARHARMGDNAVPRISIVIPALNESARIADTVRMARTGRGVEIIVVDGGSKDGTAQHAKAVGATVVDSPPGRAGQMNRGAEQAGGEILLFLHADTLLPPAYDRAVRTSLSDRDVVGGCFQLKLDAPGASLRLIERAVALRTRMLKRPYGDQALFIRRDVFQAIGGFPDVPIMEDCELVRAMRRVGKLAVLDLPATTSARRWVDRGVWRTTLEHQLYLLAYSAGVAPNRIAAWRNGASE